jgi:hypothetical protein
MNKFFGFLLMGLVLVILLVSSLENLADSQTSRVQARTRLVYAQGQAEAMVVRAQAESRLHAAQAAAITSASLLPWGVLAILGLLGLAIVALCIVVVVRRPQAGPPVLIERQIVYLPAPGQSRREVWQALSDSWATGGGRPRLGTAFREEGNESNANTD